MDFSGKRLDATSGSGKFNFETVRMEMTSFLDLWLNPVAQSKFLHTLTAGYSTGAMFVLGISAFYLLKGRDIGFAKRSFSVAATFGFIAASAVLIMGDESGYDIGKDTTCEISCNGSGVRNSSCASAIPPVAIPNTAEMKNDFAVEIPYLGGLIATRSLDTEIVGLKEIQAKMKVVFVMVWLLMIYSLN